MCDRPANMLPRRLAVVLVLTFRALSAHSQANYEIQVYGAETVPPQTLMVELHSNFTVAGQQQTDRKSVV